jgi:transcriptional regulator with GAF, ATPase, and Fis domain
LQPFDRLLADLMTRFTGLPAEEVNGEIERGLQLLVETLGTDRSSFMQLQADGLLSLTHSWARPGFERMTPAVSSPVALPWYYGRLGRGETIALPHLPEGLPPEADRERDYVRASGFKSNLTIPIAVGGRYVCAIATGTFRDHCEWDEVTIERVRIVGQILANAVYRKEAEALLRRSLAEIQALKEQLEAENVYLRGELRGGTSFADIVGRSPALRATLDQVAQVAPTDSTVLLLGETGSGKELLARALHDRSPRRARPLVKVNCAALPATLIETELFGHEKGAFTGATAAHMGRFELADGGTLFLDEIGDLALELQAKLLRVLQDGEVQRLGATRSKRVDVRLVAATNQDLERAMAEGRFRRDLYYRLSVFPIHVPPLRERREDIPLLAWAFIQRRQADLGRHVEKIPRPALDALVAYDWPGNVRELENVLERALILSSGSTLRLESSLGLPARGQTAAAERPRASLPAADGGGSLDDLAREHIRAVLDRCGGRINGPGGAAEVLQVHPNTLRSRMQKLGIARQGRPAISAAGS